MNRNIETRAEARKKRTIKEEEELTKKEKSDKRLANKENRVVLNFFLKFLFFVFIFCFLVLFYSYFFGTKGLIVNEYKIENDLVPKSFEGFKVVHFSDVHFGSSVRKDELVNVVNKINFLRPDVIVLTGDLLNNSKYSQEDIKLMSSIYSKLEASIGKYVINGNHDFHHEYFDKLVSDSGFINLNDKSELIYYKGNIPILISGMSTNLYGKDTIEDKLAGIYNFYEGEENLYNMLLMHEPDFVKDIDMSYFDLVLSGHSHNGQFKLPFIKPLILPPGGTVYYDSYYKFGNSELFVSNGIGTTGLDIRLFNRPSINFYRFVTKN